LKEELAVKNDSKAWVEPQLESKTSKIAEINEKKLETPKVGLAHVFPHIDEKEKKSPDKPSL
jgi:hypothetical protein